MTVRVHVTTCEPYRLRVTTWGTGGPPHAIVLPGLSADWRSLAPQIRLLRGLGWTVHVVDLPGFALAPALRPADAGLSRLVDYVDCVAKDLGITRALFVGHSLGGGVALHLAVRRPELVSGLILIAPAALGRSLHWIYKLYCLPLVGRALLKPRPMTATAVRQFLIGGARRTDMRFVARLVRHGIAAQKRAMSHRAVIWANQPRLWLRARAAFLPGGEQLAIRLNGELSSLSDVPALVLWGSQDRVISACDAKRCRELPLAEIHVAPRIGHSLPLEAAGWANERIARFARRLAAPQTRAA
jgi:pimeloyl-ACP methyl ester carboxylesterase